MIPFSLPGDFTLITRNILPIVNQQDVIGEDRQVGVGDLSSSWFFAPKPEPGGLIWGAGPIILMPTGSEFATTHKWSAGPTGVALMQTGGFTYGILASHVWSFAGRDSGRAVSQTFLQPFLAYQLPTATTFTLNTETSFDWVGDEWTVPLNAIVSQVIPIGGQIISVAIGGRYYAAAPDDGPEWGLRLVVTLIFPRAKT